MSTSPHPTEQTDSKIESLSDESTTGHDEALEKRVWLKLDFYLLPVVAILYLLSFLVRNCRYNVCILRTYQRYQDRTNVGNARIAGLQSDLHMTNHQYSIALTVTYIPYIAAELPSNLLLKVCSLVPPSLALS